jgi:hypothetical protein
MAKRVGRWGDWGTYEEPEGGLHSLEIAEQFLKELREVTFADGDAFREDIIPRAAERTASPRNARELSERFKAVAEDQRRALGRTPTTELTLLSAYRAAAWERSRTVGRARVVLVLLMVSEKNAQKI